MPKLKSERMKRPLTSEEQHKVEELLSNADTRGMFADARPNTSSQELREAVEDFVRDVTERNARLSVNTDGQSVD